MENPDFTRRREGVLVQGAIGKFLMVELMTMVEVREVWARGGSVPLDLMPHEYWHDPADEFPRFSEERIENF